MKLVILQVCMVVGLASCGGGGQFDGTVYRDTEVGFQIGSPGNGWRRVSVEGEGENDLAWFEEQLSAVIQVNGSCGSALDIPLPALRNHLLIGFTDREIESESLVPLASREALKTHVRASLDGVPREMVLVVLKKDECVYDFALVAPTGERFRQAEPAFDAVVSAFSDDV